MAAAFVLYLEFFAPPIIEPPEFVCRDGFQVQFLVARSPFSRRVVFRLATVDSLYSPSRYEFRGRDVLVEPTQTVELSDCVLISDAQVTVGLTETFEELWHHRGRLHEVGYLDTWLHEVAETTRDLRLAQLTWPVFGID